MLAPCDLLVGRGDSLGPRILSQRWLGLVTLSVRLNDVYTRNCMNTKQNAGMFNKQLKNLRKDNRLFKVQHM